MIIETLYESMERDEVILIEGGFCRWHLRKDGQLTIREILVIRALRGQGIGSKMLDILKQQPASSIFAKCPGSLQANHWYDKKGFELEVTETTKSGRKLNHWRLLL